MHINAAFVNKDSKGQKFLLVISHITDFFDISTVRCWLRLHSIPACRVIFPE